MLNAFVCGGIRHEEEQDGACLSPNKKSSASKRKDNNNPYSTRGLDKFSELLADLDSRRQKVYSQMNPHDISFVRFTYSNTDDFVPIVVKVKKDQNNNKKKHKSEELKVIRNSNSFSDPMDAKSTEKPNSVSADVDGIRKQHKMDQSENKDKKKRRRRRRLLLSWRNFARMMNHPSFYVPAVMIMILVLLTVFGRSVTTLCTCVMWYVVPTLSDLSSKYHPTRTKITARPPNKTPAVGSDQLLPPSPTTAGGAHSKTSAGKHSHQKSW